MAKRKKTATRKTAAKRSSKRATTPSARSSRLNVAPAAPSTDGKLDFNHAMLYARDVTRSVAFYRDLLGFKFIEDFRYEGTPVYARLRAPGGNCTIAIHQASPGANVASEGVRLYFEVGDLDSFCEKLRRSGVYFTQMPRMMPWGWRHAYCDDPDHHEISLYWAGENRLKKTVMKAAKAIEKVPEAARSR